MTAINNIAQLRKSKGLTQEELAEKAGVTVRTIQRMESNETLPRAYTLKKMAEALEVSLQELQKHDQPDVAAASQLEEQETVQQQLYILNMSCFFYLVIPWVHALIPYRLWKKNKNKTGWTIVRWQVQWTIALHGVLLLTLGYNLLVKHYFKQGAFLISYLLVFFAMYIFNAISILRMNYRIMTGKCQV